MVTFLHVMYELILGNFRIKITPSDKYFQWQWRKSTNEDLVTLMLDFVPQWVPVPLF
jgi:hypothetical protein